MLVSGRGIVRLLQRQGPLLGLILLMIVASIRYEHFFTFNNITNILLQNSMLGIVAIGMTFVILTRGIDLSVGSLFALAGITAALLSSYSLIMAIVLPVVITTLLGCVNGILVARGKLEPFIVTLAMMIGVRGFIYAYTEEKSIPVHGSISDSFAMLGRGTFFGLSIPVLLFFLLLVMAGFLLRYTALGRHVLAVGGNEEAARLMGLKVERVKLFVYSLSGALAGFAGVILTSRLGAGQPVAGLTWELDAIAAVIIGGTLLTGGKGSVYGTAVGVILLGMIYNIINLEGTISSWWQPVIRGLFLMVIVTVQGYIITKRRK
jgi:ribose/xylose/arabinose/galactoside ABC-type transport system permease subunit